ncbi:MAG TPA: trypsin-like serine protease [Gaiellaceae bacterium]|nr:trypsin-like serine protease [Gaiellaceae bacterium]
MKRLLFAAAVVSAALGAFAAAPANAILDGKPDNGAHPMVGAAFWQDREGNNYLCSGTKISEFRFLTAAHCFPPGVEVLLFFGDSLAAGPSMAGIFRPYDGWCPGCSGGVPGIDKDDVAIVQTFGPMPEPYGELPELGFNDRLGKRQKVVSVGYGLQVRPKDFAGQIGERRWVEQSVVPGHGVLSREYLKLSAAQGGVCAGDSGGPSFVGDTIAAITSFSVNPNCAGVTYSQRIDIPSMLGFISSVPNAPAAPPPGP